ncbi:ATP-dependent helicase [Vallitalea longa]|uniref:ATP-dependent helicase n=1 Tax=Vallitalea longa TaxID=2936439 RepID=A0A9W5YC95_9FIRM|nr:ATP-dependent DNA helicase [Vallitalea longa]GKX31342.1 ATP-dependent helicase [Vallitalea longa]
MDIEKDKYGFIEIRDDLINKKIIKKDSKIRFKIDNIILSEFYTGKSYSYNVINVITNESKHLYHSKKQLSEEKYEDVKEKLLSLSIIKEQDNIVIDNSVKDTERNKELIRYIFNTILPKYGFTIRESQIDLSLTMYDAIKNNRIALCEAEVGTGKTFSYLIAAIISRFSSYVTNVLPIVISTSSITLQKAIKEDYIPLISRILKTEGILYRDLTAVIRKGKSHYICDKRLKDCVDSIPFKKDKKEFKILSRLLDVGVNGMDLDRYDEINKYVKSRINVTDKCNNRCPQYQYCRYNRFLKNAKSFNYDIQICNHNYYFADIKKRSENKSEIIPDYSIVIIDESHKIINAARQIYGMKIEKAKIDRLINLITKIRFNKEKDHIVKEYTKKLKSRVEWLYSDLLGTIINDEGKETERYRIIIKTSTEKLIRRIIYNINSIIYNLDKNELKYKNELTRYTINLLLETKEKLDILINNNQITYWMELENKDKNKLSICWVPKELNKIIYSDLWMNRIPIILTSGTISERGSFTYFKHKTGIDLVGIPNNQRRAKLQEVSKSSPFNYNEKTIMYINDRLPFPDSRDIKYINSITSEIARIIKATHGHAMVLFTSYRTMELVYNRITKLVKKHSMIKMGKGYNNCLNKFKISKNGVIFAAGAAWEGIDISGDILSSIIIVKLPFAVPDPLSEYEQTCYKDFHEYKDKVILPEMIIKLKQGVGRLIRSETDTGVISILDSRMNVKKDYYSRVINALPECKVTNDIEDVKKFIQDNKSIEYFK